MNIKLKEIVYVHNYNLVMNNDNESNTFIIIVII